MVKFRLEVDLEEIEEKMGPLGFSEDILNEYLDHDEDDVGDDDEDNDEEGNNYNFEDFWVLDD